MNKQIKAGADIHAGDGGYGEGTQEGYDAFVKVRNKSLAQGRIRDLAEQAGLTFVNSITDDNEDIECVADTNGGLPCSTELEKFAELIVRECGVALNPPVQNRNVISRGQAYDLIKQHFGVEE